METSKFDLNRPWLTLDDWQKEYIFDKNPNSWNFLLSGRQNGKTTAMSIRAVELCVNYFKEGEVVLISSLTERQAMLMLKKAQIYAEAKYPNLICKDRDNKPTVHRLMFKAGKLHKGIYCYAAGEEGDSTRGYTVKKLMVDEGARMQEEYFISAIPTLSVTRGSMDIGSTPAGKKDKDGNDKFFYKCSKDEKFKKFYISAYDCPRHTKEFLEEQRNRMTKLAFAQEYLAIFTDDLRRLISDDLIEKCCILKRSEVKNKGNFYIGVDVAGFGNDECTYEVFERLRDNKIEQKENIIEKRNFTTDTSDRIKILNKSYIEVRKIGVDDGGIGFGVYSELMNDDATKRKTIALNNASRPTDKDGEKHKKLLKEEMYLNLLKLMELGRIKFLDDDEVKASLSSIQYEDEKVFSTYGHVAEGIIRALWLAEEGKSLNIFAHSF